ELRPPERLRVADDRGERGPYLVRRDRDELVLEAIQLAKLAHRALLVREQILEPPGLLFQRQVLLGERLGGAADDRDEDDVQRGESDRYGEDQLAEEAVDLGLDAAIVLV